MKNFFSFLSSGIIGILGGLIGLGGAEFRLPLLNIVFKFDLKSAIILNLFISIFTVLFSFIFRVYYLDNLSEVIGSISIAINLLLGSLIGSYMGTKMMLKINNDKLKSSVFLMMLFYRQSYFFIMK